MLVSTLSFPASSALAQDWHVDVGATSVRYDSVTTLRSGSLSPQVEWSGSSVLVSAGGTLAALDSSWTGQGQGDVSLVLGRARRLQGWGPAALLSTAGSVHSAGFRTGSSRIETRAQFNHAGAGAWIGLAGGTGWNSSGGGMVGFFGPTAGFWTRRDRWAFTATATPFRLDGFWYPELGAQAAGSYGRAEIAGYLGWRGASDSSGEKGGGWIGASLLAWLNSRVALVIAGGSYPSDLPQGLPGGRYVSLALRLATRRHPPPIGPSIRQTIMLAERSQGRLHLRVPGVQRVELVADWTDWQRVPMEHAADGSWVIPLSLTSGVYRFNLVVDGDRWIVPEGYAAVDDGFGGKAALLVVP